MNLNLPQLTRSLLCIAVFLILSLFLPQKTFGQQWMQNGKDASGHLNFYKVQANFYAYWKEKEKEEKKEKRKEKEERKEKDKKENGREGQEGEEDEEDGEYQIFKRWENYWEHRVYPDGSFPAADLVSHNWETYLKENPQRNNQRYHQAAWTSLGPTTTPGGYPGIGRINAICFDPTNSNIIWAGSPSGGLWKSTNNGTSWTTNTDNFTILGVSGIVINPVDPSIMYIATGDCDAGDNHSIGVMKSTNGGSSWNTTGLNWSVSINNRIYRILIDQNDINTILVATNMGIYVSHDAGANWTNKLSGYFYDIRPNPNASTNIYYATDGDKIYKSTDDGDTWALKYDMPGSIFRSALAVSAADPNVLYALAYNGSQYAGLFKSTDAGETFNTQSTSPNILAGTADGSGTANQGWYDLCLTVDPTDASIVYAGGIVTWKSTNSGVNWTLNNFWYDLSNGTPIVHADKHVFEWQNNTTLWNGNDGGVYKTTNGGTSWATYSNGLVISQMYRLGVSQTDTKVITGLQDNGTKLKNTDGVWRDLTGGDGMECTINPVNSSIMYGTIQNGDQLNRSTDGGLSWVDVQENIPGHPTGSWITPHALDPSNSTTIYAGYVDVWKSTDQGNAWASIGAPSASNKIVVEVAPSDPNVIVTEDGDGEIYRTTNGGSSWTHITTAGDFNMIEIHPTDPLIMWGVHQNYSVGNKVLKTIDGGATWTNISGTLPNLPANTIVYDKNSNGGLYVGMDVGVYYTDNTLSDWILYSAQLPNVEVYELEINNIEHKLYAATYGRGLWKSDLYEYSFLVEGNKTICADFNWTYTVELVPGATSYTWTLPSGWTGTSSTNTITVDPSTTSGNVQCVVGLPSGDRTYILNVTVNPNCNTSMDMDGVNDYMEVSTVPVNIANTSFTIEFWAKRGSAGTNDLIVTQGVSGTNTRLHTGFRNNNQFTFAFYGNDLNTGATYTDLNWHHWSCVYDKSIVSPSNNRFIYRDGVLVASDRSSSDLLSSGVLQIGKFDGDYFGGKIDELRIWNVARTPSEIQANLYCPMLAPPSSLKLYLPFEDGIPDGDNSFDTETIDFSGISNHGYLNNFALNGSSSNFTTHTYDLIVSGVAVVCPNLSWTYSVPSVAGATSYTWTLPSGWTGTSSTNSITVSPSTSSGTVQCVVAAPCGNLTFTLSVTANANCETAMHFDGVNDYLLAPNFSWNVNEPVTVEFWTKVNSADLQNTVLFTVGNTATNDRFMAHVPWSDSNLYWDYGDSGGNGRLSMSFTPYFDKWVHVALVSAGNGGNFRGIYINGVLIASNIGASDGPNGARTSLQLGGNGNFVKSKVDEFRIWNVMRTQAEIQSNMFCPITSPPSSLRVYYPFENGIPNGNNTGTESVTDFSGNNNHGFIQNMALTGSTSNFTNGTDITRYQDSDGDGFGNASVTSTLFCPAGIYSSVAGDCDDTNPDINPYATELCSNGVDDDCDGNIDIEINKGLNFNASGNRVNLPFYAHQAVFTVEAWIKVSASGTFRRIISWDGGSTSFFGISPDNLIAYYENGGYYNSGPNLGDNQWHHLVLVHNGYAGDNITTYVDGNVTMVVPFGNVISSSTLTLGANSNGDEGLNGSLDEVRIWNTALTQAQILQRMNRRLDGNETNLVRYYTLDHGKPGMANPAVTIAKDKTSNNAHGTLVGFTLTGSTSNWITSWTYPNLYADADGDGYGATNPWTCGSMTGYLTSNLDCNDSNPNINPYATEICGNSIDDDCDGNTDVEINKGLHFNASGNRVSVPIYAHQAVFSVEAWIKVSAAGTFRRIVTWGGTNSCDMALSSSNLLGYFENGGGYHGGPSLGDNQWHHVVLVHNGYGTNNVTTYVDGIVAMTVTMNSVLTTSTLTLGADSGGGAALDGSLDDVRFWNVALTQTQIRQRMNRRLDGNETNLVRYYTLDHGKPGMTNTGLTTALDKTSNNAHGTLIGFSLTGATSNWITSWTYPTLYADADADGFGGATPWTCGTMTGFKTTNLDCNDNNNTINPAATDICGNGVDENCNGITDENTLALNLDGVDDNVSFGNTLGNFGTGDFTIESRIKTTVSGRYILSKRPVCGYENFWNIKTEGDGKLTLEMYQDIFGGNGGGLTSNSSVTDGNWHHFAFARKSGIIKVYIDGSLETSTTLTTNLNNSVNLNLGSNLCGNPYGGSMDELRIWNVARTADEINDFKNTSIPATVTGLIAYYDFNHPTAIGGGTNTGLTLLDDRTANNYDGTLTGFALSGSTSNWIGNPGTTLTWYADADNDGYGNFAVTLNACYQPAGYVSNSNDCDDTKGNVHPGATELCSNNYDDNCDGTINEMCPDLDMDGYTAAQGDCNDNNAAIHPGAPELCNGIDDNCNGQIDEGVQTTYYQDLDNDMYGNPNVTTLACSPPMGYVANSTDCNDNNANIHPGATELCNDIDDDCDGLVDEGIPTNTYYQDADADGYGNPNVSIQKCNQPSGYVTNNTDCQDHNAAIHPGATEELNGIDDNCDGSVDEGATGLPVTGITQPCFQFIEDSIKRFITHYNLPATTVVFGKNEKLYYKRSFGYEDIANTKPSQSYNRGRIASCSKPVTMFTILKLIQEGHLHFDDKVFGPGSILGDDPYYSGYTDMRINNITVQNLFDHKAGFDKDSAGCFPSPTYPYSWSFGGCDPIAVPLAVTNALNEPNPVSSRALIKFLLLQGLKHDPGTFYSYSNTGYNILGRVIAKVTGMEYETYVQDSIMHQLGVCDMEVAGNYLSDKKEREFEYRDGGSELDIDGSGHRINFAYGAGNITAGDAFGGWIASARDLAALYSAANGLSGHPDILNSTVLPFMPGAFGGAWNAHNSYWSGGGTGNIFVMINPTRRDGTPGFDNEFFGGLASWVFANMPACANYDLMLAPVTNSDHFVFSSIQTTSANVAWTAGSGNKRIIVVKEGSPVDAYPVDGLNYVANASLGSGTNLGNSNFVVYDGAGTGFSISNLLPGKRYYFRAFEYNQNTATGDYSLYKLCECGTAQMSTGIMTGSITGPLCAGSNVTVNYTSTGMTFNSGNSFTAQLSNPTGDFSSAVSIGSIASTSINGSISCIIPSGTIQGSGYRIRVVSSDPSSTGVDNGTDIIINALLTWYADTDADGFGNSATSQQACAQPTGYVLNSGDCNDSNNAINPFAVELCGNGVDDNCDGVTDQFPNNALQFDGVDDVVTAASFVRPTAMTMEAWVKVGNNTGIDVIASWSNNTNYYARCFVENGYVWYTEYSAVGGGDYKQLGSWYIGDTNWHHIALVRNGMGVDNVTIYIDGVLRLTGTVNVTLITDDFRLGTLKWEGNDLDFFAGAMDEVRIWNTARTVTEINANMSVDLLGNEAGLLRYYDFNQGKPGNDNAGLVSLREKTSNAAHGTLKNFALSGSVSNYVSGNAAIHIVREGADTDGDGFTSCFDCNDNNTNVNPYAAEVCGNSIDDDCDGNTDFEVNKALNFDGVDDKITVPVWPLTTTFTAEAWIKTIGTNSYHRIICWEGTNSATINISNANLLAYLENGGGVHGGPTIGDNQWHHIAVVKNGLGANNVTGYVDGNVAFTATFSNSLTTSTLTIGAENGGAGAINGTIDEVRVWSAALTQAQIRARMNFRLNGNETDLVRYFNFDHGKPGLDNAVITILKDKTSNNAHGTLNGFTLSGPTSNWVTSWPYSLYADNDNDGFGGSTTWTCGSMTGYVTTTGDCDDANTNINPSAIDICGNGIDENCNGVTDENTLSLKFDGLDDVVNLGSTLGNFGTGNFTVEARFKSTGTDKVIIGKRVSCSCGNFWNIRIYYDGRVNFEIFEDGGCGNGANMLSTTTVNDGNWHQVAVTRTGNLITLYIDGIPEATGTSSANINNAGNTQIGNSVCGNSDMLGEIDEVHLWNVARSAADIYAYRNASLPVNVTGLMANYDFNNPSAIAGGNNSGQTMLDDRTSNNFDGTLSNFALNGSASNWVGNPGTTLDWYADADGDAYGNPALHIVSCTHPAGSYVNNNLDCNDSNPNINPGHAEIPGNGVDDDCDGVADESSSLTWVLLPNGSGNGSCSSGTNCCTHTYCYGLQFTPASTGILTTYTTGFFIECLGSSSPINTNASCVMNDISNQINGCSFSGHILFNSSGNNGTIMVTAGVPVIVHQLCLNVPDGVTLQITKDVITNLTFSIDGENIVTELPSFTPVTVTGNLPPVITAGSISACYSSVSAAQIAAIAATTATDDCPGTISMVATTSGTCSAVVTVTAMDACGLTSSVNYNTRIDNVAPEITTGTIAACYASLAAAQNAALAATTAEDNCPGELIEAVSTVGTCSAVITVTETDGCGNVSMTTYNTRIDNTPPVITTGTIASCYPTAEAAEAAALEATTAADNCPGTIIEVASTVGTCSAVVTVTETDGCGNQSTTTYSTRIDNTSPVITTGTIASCYLTVAEAELAALAATTAVDNCTGTIIETASTVGTCSAIVTVTETDGCGNQSTTTYNTRIDNASPVITSGSIATCYHTVAEAESAALAATSAVDNCPGTIIETASTEGTCSAIVTVTETDGCGNQSTTTYNTRIDNTPPVITTGTIASCYMTVAAAESAALAATSAVDNCPGTIIETASTTGTCSAVVTVTETDGCGNQSTTTYSTRIDNTAPVITSGMIASCYHTVAEAESAALAATSALDDCPGTIIETASTTGTCSAIVTVTETDGCGNQSTTTYTTRIDNTSPVITSGTIAACYHTVAEAESAALLATTAVDDCPGTIIETASTIGTCSAVVTVTETDACGNQSTTTYTTRIDNTAPAITSGSIASCYHTVAEAESAALLATTAVDDCPGTIIETANTTGTCSAVVTVTETDGCGNQSTTTYTTRIDNASPVITSGSIASCYHTVAEAESAALAATSALDDCPGTIIETASTEGTCSAIVTVTETDGCGNQSTTTYNTRIDNTPPEITTGTIASCYMTVAAAESAALAATSAVDNCPGTIIETASTTGTCSAVVTVTETDGCGNMSMTTYTTRIDNTPPVITAGTIASCYMTVAAAESAALAATTAVDDCPGAIIETASATGTCSAVVTVTETDGCGNQSTTTYSTRIDNTSPVITSGTIAACYHTVAEAESAALAATTAVDNCPGTIIETASTTGTCSGVVTVAETDGCGNQSTTTYSTRIDNTSPVITSGTIAACYHTVAEAESAALLATTAVDDCPGAIIETASTTGTCSAVVTVTETDACGNQSTTTYTTRIDNTPPVITTGTIAACYMTVAEAESAALAATTAVDNCTGSITEAASTVGTCSAIVTVTETDGCGNQSLTTYATRIGDSTPPVITAGTIASCYHTVAEAESAALAATTAVDNCPGAITETASTTGTCSAVVTVTETDECGNQSTTTYDTRIDNSSPVITTGTIGACYHTVEEAESAALLATTAIDDCPGTIIETASTTGTCSAVVTVTETDGCGNQSITTYNTRIDNTPPVITTGTIASCYMTVAAAESAALAATTAADNCPGAIIEAASTTGMCSAVVTVTETDGCGNQSITTYNTRIDNTPPVITTGTIASCYMTVAAAESAALAATTAVDDCPGAIIETASTTGTCNAVVTVTETDGCGNQSSTTYTTRIDDTAPAITSGAIATCYHTVVEAESAALAATTAIDDCPGTIIETASTVGTCSAVVTVTEMDGCGNQSTTTYNTRIDNTSPAITSGAIATCYHSVAEAESAALAATSAVDDCPGTIIETASTIGTCSAVVTVTETDGCGNQSTTTYTTRIDNTPPVITTGTIAACYMTVAEAESAALAATTAVDNCTGSITEAASTVGTCSAIVTVTEMDGCGNQSLTTYATRIGDSTPPVITAGTIASCYHTVAEAESAALAATTAVDNCPGAITETASTTGTCSAVVTVTETDECGNQSTTTYDTRIDNSSPVITTGTIGACYHTVEEAESAALLATTAIDDCPGTIIETASTTGTCSAVVTVTETDGCGNQSFTTYTTRIDNTPPVITTGTIASCYMTVAAAESAALAATTAADNCPGAIIEAASTTGMCSAVVTVTETDGCGNQSITTYNTRIDNTPPVITTGTIASCYMTVAAAESAALAATTAVDDCPGTIIETASTTGTCNAVVTVTETDGCGNQSSTTYTTRIDDTAPAITSGAIATCYHTVVEAESAALAATTAIDDCPGTIIETASTVGTCSAVVTVTEMDGCGNQSTTTYNTRIDNTSPAITSGAIATCYHSVAEAESAALAATSAVDDCPGTIIETASTIGTCSAVVTVTETDGCGNQSTTTYNTRIDNTAPEITTGTIASCYMTVAAAESAALEATTAVDNCTGAIVEAASTVGTCSAIVTVTETDGCGNQSTTTYTTRIDNSPPTITAGTIASCYQSVAAAELAALAATTAVDDCPGAIIETASTVGTCTALVTVTETDGCGNQSSITFNTSIHLTAPAEFGTPVPTSTIVSCPAAAIPPTILPVVKDVCGTTLTPSAPMVGGTYATCEGTITYTYSYADCSGLPFTWTFTYTIERNDFTVPASGAQTVTCLDDINLNTITLPPVVDNCGNTIVPSLPSGPVNNPNPLSCGGTVTYTWTYTDCEGNTHPWNYVYTINCQSVTLKVFLEGPFNTGNNMLSPTLNTNHILPGQDKMLSPNMSVRLLAPYTPFGQPYNIAPWNYSGNSGSQYGDPTAPGAPMGVIPYPADVVDWVLVTVRKNGILPAQNIWTCAGWLHADGQVTFPDPCGGLVFNPVDHYYVLVQHRMHLGVLSPAEATLSCGGMVINWDFTTSDSYAPVFRYGQKLMASGIWAMHAGNGEQTTSIAAISSLDRTTWRIFQNAYGYSIGDYNMSAFTESAGDEGIWKTNQNKTSGIIFY